MGITTGSTDKQDGGIAWVEYDGLSVAEVTITETEDGDLVITVEPSDGSGKTVEGFINAEDRQ